MRSVQRDAARKRTDAYADAKRLLHLTRDVVAAENMYVATCARISAEETLAADLLMAKALMLLQTELGRKPTAYDIREMSRLADAEEVT